MRFVMLCYGSESLHRGTAEEAVVMAKHLESNAKLKEAGKLGPNLRLMPTSTAVTVRGGADAMVLDGPFAETKEVLLGFWVFDAASLEEAIAVAREYASHRGGAALELRPVMEYYEGAFG